MLLAEVDKTADRMTLRDRDGHSGRGEVDRGGPDVVGTEKHAGRWTEGLDLAVRWISGGLREADTPGYRWDLLES